MFGECVSISRPFIFDDHVLYFYMLHCVSIPVCILILLLISVTQLTNLMTNSVIFAPFITTYLTPVLSHDRKPLLCPSVHLQRAQASGKVTKRCIQFSFGPSVK